MMSRFDTRFAKIDHRKLTHIHRLVCTALNQRNFPSDVFLSRGSQKDDSSWDGGLQKYQT